MPQNTTPRRQQHDPRHLCGNMNETKDCQREAMRTSIAIREEGSGRYWHVYICAKCKEKLDIK